MLRLVCVLDCLFDRFQFAKEGVQRPPTQDDAMPPPGHSAVLLATTRFHCLQNSKSNFSTQYRKLKSQTSCEMMPLNPLLLYPQNRLFFKVYPVMPPFPYITLLGNKNSFFFPLLVSNRNLPMLFLYSTNPNPDHFSLNHLVFPVINNQ